MAAAMAIEEGKSLIFLQSQTKPIINPSGHSSDNLNSRFAVKIVPGTWKRVWDFETGKYKIRLDVLLGIDADYPFYSDDVAGIGFGVTYADYYLDSFDGSDIGFTIYPGHSLRKNIDGLGDVMNGIAWHIAGSLCPGGAVFGVIPIFADVFEVLTGPDFDQHRYIRNVVINGPELDKDLDSGGGICRVRLLFWGEIGQDADNNFITDYSFTLTLKAAMGAYSAFFITRDSQEDSYTSTITFQVSWEPQTPPPLPGW